MKNNFVYIYAGIVSIISMILFIWLLKDYSDAGRLKQNQSLLLHNGVVEITETGTGNSHASTPALTLRSDEFKLSGDTLTKIARNVGIKPSRISDAATVGAVTHADIEVPVSHTPPDTVLYMIPSDHPPADSLVCFSWHDAWMSLSGCVSDSLFRGTISSNDTLDIIVHRVPKRFLFFRFGCREVRMDIISRNPHTKLTYARLFRLIK